MEHLLLSCLETKAVSSDHCRKRKKEKKNLTGEEICSCCPVSAASMFQVTFSHLFLKMMCGYLHLIVYVSKR